MSSSTSQYFKLYPDTSDPLAMVCHEWQSHGFNEYRLCEARRIEDWDPNITYYASGEHAEDYLFPAVTHWLLFSERVREAFEQRQIDDVQFLPVRVIHKESGQGIGPYWALNVLKAVEAIDIEHTRWVTPYTPGREHPLLDMWQEAFRADALKGVDLFRLKLAGDISVAVYVSQRVKKCLAQIKATGFDLSSRPVY